MPCALDAGGEKIPQEATTWFRDAERLPVAREEPCDQRESAAYDQEDEQRLDDFKVLVTDQQREGCRVQREI
jgi:hypothetical protein